MMHPAADASPAAAASLRAAQVGEAATVQAKADFEDACHIVVEWRELAEAAEVRDGELTGVKARFRETTRQEVRRLWVLEGQGAVAGMLIA